MIIYCSVLHWRSVLHYNRFPHTIHCVTRDSGIYVTQKNTENNPCVLFRLDYSLVLMTALPPAPHHIILFNIASRTRIGLTSEDERKVYDHIESTMNGDGLYEGASKETILQAYHDLEMGDVYGLDWVDHITHILEELDLIKPYIKH